MHTHTVVTVNSRSLELLIILVLLLMFMLLFYLFIIDIHCNKRQNQNIKMLYNYYIKCNNSIIWGEKEVVCNIKNGNIFQVIQREMELQMVF